MGVFKWLRRERVTVTTHVSPNSSAQNQCLHSATQVDNARTEQYIRDLAEFQARRSSGPKELPDTPVKKKCGRNSLPVSCTDCTAAHDNTFNYEKKSAVKYKKKTSKRARSTTPDRQIYEPLPNIQFLFQNQVFMPGNLFPTGSFTEPQKFRRHSRRVSRSPDLDFIVQKHIEFQDDEQAEPPAFYKNNSLPFDVDNFLECQKSDEDDVDGSKAAGDVKGSNQSDSPSKDSEDTKLWEVMTELRSFDQWADEQLQVRSSNTSKSDDSKSDTSAYGLPIASASDLDVTADGDQVWSVGKWGVVPVQVKRLRGVTIDHVRRKRNTEINILRKCRHPNIILLMGLYPDINGNIRMICERYVDSVHGIIHVQGRILSAQTAVQYALDVANALVFLRMQGYIHTELASSSVVVTSHDTAKLADLDSCARVHRRRKKKTKEYTVYSPEPQYVNIDDTRASSTADCEPLISEHPSETYLTANAVAKPYKTYRDSDSFNWQAPELFVPNEDGMVHPCSKSDVYSLCLVLWESCNAALPFKNLVYDKLKEQYTLWKTGIPLPTDGTYPGCLLALLQSGLKLQRQERCDLETLQNTLQQAKRNLDELGYIIIPARLPTKRSNFSSIAWDTTSPTDSECLSPQNIEHKAVVHKTRDSSTESEKDCSKSDESPFYESIPKSRTDPTYSLAEKCYIYDEEISVRAPVSRSSHLPDRDFSSACSTPIAKIRARIKDMDTTGALHRSDSTEYCSILSPNRTVNFADERDHSAERPTAKLSRSFTPKSYKPLHIKVPEYNLDSIKPLLKGRNSSERSSYNFDIKNYSLPTTPIARSNKLRKNAWLSGDLGATDQNVAKVEETPPSPEKKDCQVFKTHSAPETSANLVDTSSETTNLESDSPLQDVNNETLPECVETVRDSITGLRRTIPPQDFLSPESDDTRDRMSTCSFKTVQDRNSAKYKVEEDILASVNVKPLVAIHERWIYEANRKTGRSMSLPEDNRCQIPAVKPASHCVDTLQKSLPQLNVRRNSGTTYRAPPVSPNGNGKHGNNWDQFCKARENIAKSINFPREADRHSLRKRDIDKCFTTEEKQEPKTDQSTDTKSIEEFIREMIRKEFQHLVQEISDETSTASVAKSEDLVNRGVANIMESLTNEDPKPSKRDTKSFSRVKINGNNKPLLQITFSRTGENTLQVLDSCVNVTICDNGASRERVNQSMEDTLTEEVQVNSLKRCQAFNALQEARSTEDLYIDDDLSAQMQENFGGRVKLIPLHGSLHEVLCERQDDCCLVKVKQENGCDTIYFRCDNSDSESRDCPDGPRDTVLVKRSFSLVEEHFRRRPRPLRQREAERAKVRPKSEVILPKLSQESRVLSNSTPSLPTHQPDAVELNIESVMSYQDSSSDECLRCQAEGDDFELIERKIEEDLANSNMSSLNCGCLEKISEENLSTLNEDTDRD